MFFDNFCLEQNGIRAIPAHCFIFTCTVSSRAHRVTAPIDGKVDSGNEAGGVGCQEGDAVCHFLYLPWSAEGVRLLTPFQKLVVKKTEWALNTSDAVESVTLLQSFTLITALITWQKVLSNRQMNKWITSMGIISKWRWCDMLPVYTAAHLVLLFCGHLWRWRQGWRGESKAAKLVTSQIFNSK